MFIKTLEMSHFNTITNATSYICITTTTTLENHLQNNFSNY